MACAALANFPCLIYFDKTTHFYLKPEISRRHGLLPAVTVSWLSSNRPALVKVLPFFGRAVGFGFLPGFGLFALAVHRSRQKAALSLVRWPCFGRVGRTSTGLAVLRYGPGRSLLEQNLVRWRKRTPLPEIHQLKSKNYFKRLFDHEL